MGRSVISSVFYTRLAKLLSRREPAFLLGGKDHEKVLQVFFIGFRQRLRDRCSESSRNFLIRAVAFVACFGFCVSGLLLAPNVGWVGSKPQVVLAAGGSSGGGGADDSSWDRLVSRVGNLEKFRDWINSTYSTKVSNSISALEKRVSDLETFRDYINNDYANKVAKSIMDLQSFRDYINNVYSAKVSDSISTLQGKVDYLNGPWASDVATKIGDLQKFRDYVNNTFAPKVDSIGGKVEYLNGPWATDVATKIGDLQKFRDYVNNTFAPKVDSLGGKVEYLNGPWATKVAGDISSLNDFRTYMNTTFVQKNSAAIQAVDSRVSAVDKRVNDVNVSLAALSSKVDGLGVVDLTVVTHAIDVVRDSVNTVNDTALKIFNFLHDDFWPLFQDLHTLIDNSVMQILDKVTGIDNKFAGFWSDFKDFRDVTSGFYLNFAKVMADFQKGVFSGLIAVSEWLKAIYYSIQNLPAPETSEIHLPPKDGGGGGSGTNIWDVLKQLIESLGTIVGKLVDALSKLADLVSQLFVPKDLSFITDTFNGISSKFDKKFAIFIDLGSSLKGLFSSRHALKDFSLSFAGASVVVPLSMVSTLAGQMRPLLTGLFVLLTATGVYRRFTDGEVVS
jgi:hypothetical protein